MLVVGIIAVFIVGLIAAVIMPSLPGYRYASVAEARSFSSVEAADVVTELGDTNGPFRLKGVRVSGLGKPFHFDLTFDGRTTNWTRPGSNHTSFVATIFVNRRGNQFAIIRERTD